MRRLTEKVRPYLKSLKSFVEGNKDLREWPAWWRKNATYIEKNEGRTRYLKIKQDWQAGAYQILQHYGIPYKPNVEINWARCKECGEPLFRAVPHETTKEQIREFMRTSNWPNKSEFENEGWLHPGIYCPNGCTSVLISYSSDVE